MIVDTSAVMAILRAEPDARAFAEAIEKAATRRMSAASYLEAAVVMDNARDPLISRRFDEFVVGQHVGVPLRLIPHVELARLDMDLAEAERYEADPPVRAGSPAYGPARTST